APQCPEHGSPSRAFRFSFRCEFGIEFASERARFVEAAAKLALRGPGGRHGAQGGEGQAQGQGRQEEEGRESSADGAGRDRGGAGLHPPHAQ
uniref:Uncharacterized protein n=1 Tax=Aegilops tauschii subsp. strangulata TaxID=200361 RepID=A0A453PVL4_AEGTS